MPDGLQSANVPVFDLDDKVMERVASTETPQPLLATVRLRRSSLADLAGATFVLVGDRINDPGNAGTMLRSAEAAGVDAVVFTKGSVDVFNPKVVRASAGALFAVPVVTDVDARRRAARCRTCVRSGRRRTTGRRSPTTDFTAPTALVVGNEAHGLDPSTGVDEWITIPHRGRAESLNVAMAATLLVFEVARQRGDR